VNLVPNQWYAILDPGEVPAGRPVGWRRMGRDLVFWRSEDGQLRAAEDRCPHRAAALSIGTVEDGCLTCPFHGFRFADDGSCVKVPAHPDLAISPKMRLAMVAVREAYELVWMWSGPDAPDEGPVPFFDGFEGTSWRGSQHIVAWPVHYSRAVENQLDYAHLSFVHRTTIGRFTTPDTEMDVTTEGRRIGFRNDKSPGDGIQFIGPNVWRLWLAPTLFNFLAFAPVDDEHMVYYLRTYQSRVLVPGLDWMVNKLSSMFNPRILAQDQRVVSTQRPKMASLSNGDVYVKSDRPLIEYLKWREGLQSQASPTPGRRTPGP